MSSLESRNWYIIGYKNGKGKKPRRFDVWHFQELVTKDEALRRLRPAYPFSVITDIAPRRDDTRLDDIAEWIKGQWWWLLLPLTLIAVGLVAGIHSHLMWPAIILTALGIATAVAFAPRSPV